MLSAVLRHLKMGTLALALFVALGPFSLAVENRGLEHHSFQLTFVKIRSRETEETRALAFAAEICAPHVRLDAAKVAWDNFLH